MVLLSSIRAWLVRRVDVVCGESFTQRSLVAMLIVLASSISVDADEDTVRLNVLEKWTTVFGASTVTQHVIIDSDRPVRGTVRWAHTANRRTISRGEQPIALGNEPTTVKVSLRVPPVKDGVVFQTQLTVTFSTDGTNTQANATKPINVFPRDAFDGRAEWLAALRITVFDPDGRTVERFETSDIPFTRTHNFATVANHSDGLLVIGEGADFLKNRSLAKAILDVAGRGGRVLCLAPHWAEFLVPGSDESLPAPSELRFARNEIIRALDKRLDAYEWLTGIDPVQRRLSFRSQRSTTLLESTTSEHGWPWLETRYPNGGRVVICGFGLVKHWDAGPTPRFLMARLIESIGQTDSSAEDGS